MKITKNKQTAKPKRDQPRFSGLLLPKIDRMHLVVLLKKGRKVVKNDIYPCYNLRLRSNIVNVLRTPENRLIFTVIYGIVT